MKCAVCNWHGMPDKLKGFPPFTDGCPECWRFGRYIPVESEDA